MYIERDQKYALRTRCATKSVPYVINGLLMAVFLDEENAII
jgi:hypothetical protein